MLTWLWELAQPVLEGVAATAAPYGAAGVEKRNRLRAQLNQELDKPQEQQDANYIRRVRMVYLSLSARASQHIARRLEEKATSLKARVKDARSEISEYAAAEACCAAATWVDLRDAASCTALANYERQASYQGFTEWNALLERYQPQVTMLELELSEELQHPPPRTDMCRACATRLEQMEYKEGLARALQHDREAEYRRLGMLPPAPPAASGSSGGGGEEPATGVPSVAAAAGAGGGQGQQQSAAEQQVQEAQQPTAAEHPQQPLPPLDQQVRQPLPPVEQQAQEAQQPAAA